MAKPLKRAPKKTKQQWTKFKRAVTLARKELERTKIEDPAEYKGLLNFSKAIGKKIKATRIEAGISVEELSERADLPLDYVKDLEEGKINSSIGDYFYIAHVLNVKISSFFEGIKLI